MTARELEAAMLTRCMTAARENTSLAQNQCEANIFQLAAMVLRSQFPQPSANLERASELYFVAHPTERLTAAEVVRNGWVVSLPRLRDRLSRKLLLSTSS